MKQDDKIVRRMLSTIRESSEKKTNKNIINEEANTQDNKGKSFAITKSTPQFGDVRVDQEESIQKTIGERLEMDDNGLVYYPDNKDLVVTAKLPALNVAFQFRYVDPSGEGLYIWANALQLTDANNRTLGKIRDAFVSWKQSLNQNSDLLAKLHKAASND